MQHEANDTLKNTGIDFGRVFYILRWLFVPLMTIAAFFATFLQESFQWKTGPYGFVFGSWLVGYGLWAGHTAMAKTLSRNRIDSTKGLEHAKLEIETALSNHRSSPRAIIEWIVAFGAIGFSFFVPEAGFGIIVLMAAHLGFVVAWRRYGATTLHDNIHHRHKTKRV